MSKVIQIKESFYDHKKHFALLSKLFSINCSSGISILLFNASYGCLTTKTQWKGLKYNDIEDFACFFEVDIFVIKVQKCVLPEDRMGYLYIKSTLSPYFGPFE